MFARNNLFSYDFNDKRGRISTEHTNRNRASNDALAQDSLFKNNEYILEVENLVRNRKREHQSSIDNDKRSTFFGNYG